jgi:hypothetical protein
VNLHPFMRFLLVIFRHRCNFACFLHLANLFSLSSILSFLVFTVSFSPCSTYEEMSSLIFPLGAASRSRLRQFLLVRFPDSCGTRYVGYQSAFSGQHGLTRMDYTSRGQEPETSHWQHSKNINQKENHYAT